MYASIWYNDYKRIQWRKVGRKIETTTEHTASHRRNLRIQSRMKGKSNTNQNPERFFNRPPWTKIERKTENILFYFFDFLKWEAKLKLIFLFFLLIELERRFKNQNLFFPFLYFCLCEFLFTWQTKKWSRGKLDFKN